MYFYRRQRCPLCQSQKGVLIRYYPKTDATHHYDFDAQPHTNSVDERGEDRFQPLRSSINGH
ncbi:Uncharacterised protein [Vibrio cholerae]|nr:Uncharacterised protein [Vibrio cholerae]